MEIDLLCRLLDQLLVTDVAHLSVKDEDLLCHFFGRLCIPGDVFMLPTSYNTSPVGYQEELNVGTGHGLHGSSFFALTKVSGLPWCSLQAQFWVQGYAAKVMFLGRQIKRDFFLFIFYSTVRRKNDWLAFGFLEDDQSGSNVMFYILWRYRNLELGLKKRCASFYTFSAGISGMMKVLKIQLKTWVHLLGGAVVW